MIGLLIAADFRRDFMRKKNPKANKAFITAPISKIRHFYTHFKNQEFKQIFVRGGNNLYNRFVQLLKNSKHVWNALS